MFFKSTNIFNHTLLLSVLCSMGVAHAAPLNISDVPLELTPALPPNVLILTDDSGSMDWEVLTQNPDNSGAFCSSDVNGSCNTAGLTHRVPESGSPPSCEPYIDPATSTANGDYVSGYLYIVAFNSNEFIATDSGNSANDPFIRNCYIAADNEFRVRNSKFNPLYFDPNKTYIPWAGVDINGNSYTNADITNAPENPYDPGNAERINLTSQQPGFDALGNRVNGEGFKYYDWNDANNDGIFDSGEEVENLISTKDAATQQNFANWFTYYRKREYVAKAIASHAVANNGTARLGFATTNENTSANSLRVQTLGTTQRDSVLDGISMTNSSGTSTLRSAYEKVGNYFACEAGDIFNSTGSSSPGSTDCPLLAAPGGECQSNNALFITDGFDDGMINPSVGNADGDNNTNFDGGAFADSFSNTLADVAMYFYETDLQSSLLDNVPVTSIDFSRYPSNPPLVPGSSLHQHLNTNTVGIFNNVNLSLNTPFPPADPKVTNSSFWDNPATFIGKVDDLRHAAYNGRGSFIPAFAGNDFPAVMNNVQSVFSRAASNSGSIAAMAFNTQSITQGTVVFRTFSDLATNSGELAAQRINPDGSFNVDSVTGNPIFEWSAATQIDSQAPSSRSIFTYNPGANAGINFTLSDLTSSGQNTQLNQPLPLVNPTNIDAKRINYLRGDTSDEGTIFDNGDMRIRAPLTTVNGITTGGKIGDITHSSPVFVGQPPFANRFGGAFPTALGETYFEFRTQTMPVNIRDRDQLVYVGANDGMLHAFYADPNSVNKGKEKFAYIPNILLSEIGEFTSPDYSHRFYVDSTPSVNDAYIDPRPLGGAREWRTVLVGGLGAGGKGYYALDITDPNNINTGSVMWEFTDSDDPDLGFTYSRPIIAMSNDAVSGEQRWVAIFGNGFNSTSTDGDAAIYILFLDAGYDGWSSGDFVKITTRNGIAESTTGTPNGIGGVTGTDTDGNGTVDRLYAGDLQGNVYVFDISDSSPSNWNLASTLFTASFDTGTLPVEIQPITTKPTVVANPAISGSYIVIVGTGSYFTTDDALSTEIQSIYGLLDNPGGNTSTITKYSSPSQLVEQEFTTSVDNNSGLVVRTVTNNPVVYDDTGSNQVRGWFIDFDIPPPNSTSGVQFPGERPVRNLQLRNNQLFFSTVIPQDGTSCAPPAGGFGLSVNALTGGVDVEVIFDINIDGVFDVNDNILISNVSTVIAGTRFESAPSDSTFIGDYRVTQLSNSNIDRILVNPDLNSGGAVGALLGRHSWKELRM